jgi:hypothetical protein
MTTARPLSVQKRQVNIERARRVWKTSVPRAATDLADNKGEAGGAASLEATRVSCSRATSSAPPRMKPEISSM